MAIFNSLLGLSGQCDANGNPIGATTFAQWVSQYQFSNGIASSASRSQAPALFINVEDLNLTRVHYSTTLVSGNNLPSIAAYVCNHLGPQDSSGNSLTVAPTQDPQAPANSQTQTAAINTAIGNAQSGLNSVACVAMDYVYDAPPFGGQYTRFYAFGPSGELLPSVNLDGRGEKFLPGACTVCHGGSTYASTGSSNIGAYFLPYDVYNLAFSTASGLTYSSSQLQALNENILFAAGATTPATKNLINQWYTNAEGFNYFPSDQNAGWSTNFIFYHDVVARSCRTCHTAQPGSNWDALGPTTLVTEAAGFVCGSSQSMPDSLITFNRFWDSENPNRSELTNQAGEFVSVMNEVLGSAAPLCPPPVFVSYPVPAN